MDEAPFKRVKTEENDVTRELLKLATDRDEESSLKTDRDADPSCAVQAIHERAGGKSVLAPAGRSSSARRRRKNAVGRFLARLPIPLDYHSSLFVSLGIRNMSYIRSVASMPQHVLNELMYALQGQGLSFVEALVLRDALDELPVDRNSPRHRPRSTEGGSAVGVDVFLDSLRPSMKHHASTFRKLGLYTSAHMSALGKTKAQYAEVETTLRSKGLSWMDCFIVRMAVQVQARRP
ncbi:hypothetical protein C8T65DRAFT_634657 [Cerioporus squamosus]|nr:hypothetical protein C8T65DRAFT_634657 [Cerioporus squamosus]